MELSIKSTKLPWQEIASPHRMPWGEFLSTTLPQLQVLEDNRWEIPPTPNRTSANNLLCHWCYLWISHHQMTNLGNYASCKTDTYSHVIAMYRNDQNLAYSSSFKVRVFNVTFVL